MHVLKRTDSVDEARLADLQRQLMLCKKKVEKFKDQVCGASFENEIIMWIFINVH